MCCGTSFLFFLFYQYTALSSRAEDGHQMYSGCLVVGEISPIPTLIFTGGGKKCKVWPDFYMTSLNYEPPAFKNAARYLNSETNLLSSDDRLMSLSSLVTLGPHTPMRTAQ